MSNLTLEQLESMSDEDFGKIDFSQLPTEDFDKPTEETTDEVPVVEEEETPQPEVDTIEDNPVDDSAVATSNEAVSNEPVVADNQGHAETEPNVEVGAATPVVEEPKSEAELTAEKAFFDKVTAEFTANGRQFKIDNPEDVVSLMQKGLNYNQKMAAIKPSMKIVKALSDNGIQSVEELGFLLDLKNKKPEAIAKLIQEAGVDAYEFNEEKANSYTPSVPQVDDATINFEMTAKSLESNPHFGTLVQQLHGFDEVSKQEVFKNPHLLNLLTNHVEHGFYDKICARVEQEQALGRLTGMSFLQAYDTVGNMLFGQPQQTAPVHQQVAQVAPQPVPVPVPVASKPKAVNNTARQAAAGTPGSATPTQKYTYTLEDLENMSDDEFAKVDPKFLPK